MLPEPLVDFLDAKYGIVPPGRSPAIVFNGKELEVEEP